MRRAIAVIVIAAATLGARAWAAPPQAIFSRLDISGAIPYFIADGRGKTGVRDGDAELARWALDAWQRSSGNVIRFDAAPESSAIVRVYWAEPTEGQYGEMQSIAVGGRLGAAVYIRPDMDALGDDIAQATARDRLLRDTIVYLTCVHEIGHALGLRHTRDYRDIMYFFGYGGDIPNYFGRYRRELRSRADIAKVAGISAGDVARLKTLYDLP